ncbi:FMN-binding glutamate synthase family protein [Candidatus Poribacteria bacterium]|nr:FMN-binding glutamate synthase family protein [Candidatus Poribacteria bacterium]
MKIKLENRPDYVEIKEAPSRFRNAIGKYKVRRSLQCINCGTCVQSCPYGVHVMHKNTKRVSRPKDYKCIGFECQNKPFYCIDKCPVNALSLAINPLYETFGDYRWTSDLILSTWAQAETGKIPHVELEYRTGRSGGGFDRLKFDFPEEEIEQEGKGARGQGGKEGTDANHQSPITNHQSPISTSIALNRRNDGRPEITIDIPIYGGGMSYGSVSLPTMLARAKAAKVWNTFTCTGEGGYPEELKDYDDYVITQVATGLFGVREETIQRVRIVEFKYAQGAKPGLGGHLLGDKVTKDVARMREAVAGSALFSPFPFHSVYSVEDHKKHVDWIKEINPKALVSVKVATPTDVDMVAVGSYHAGAHIIHLDGSYGGTGAAPDIAKKNIAMPIEYAIPKVHRFLVEEGIRNEMVLIASGGLRTAYDVAKAIALGADGVVIGTAEMVALECTRCSNCESGRGCARGIATTDPELSDLINMEWGAQRIINLYAAWRSQLVEILRRFRMTSIKQLRGRTDCLIYQK